MKKILCTLGIIGLLTPFSIKALTGDVIVTCADSKLSKGATTTCTVKGNITEGVSAVSAKVDLGENLSFVSFTPDSSWQGDGEEGNIELYTDSNKSGNFNIGTITVKAENNTGVSTSVGLKDVKLSDASFTESEKNVKPFSIRIPSEVNTLSDIKIGSDSITGFSSSKTDYEITVSSSLASANITATLTDTSATVTGDTGNKQISYGINNFSFTVTSESGVSKTYNLKVNRPEIRELKSLKINNEEIKLISGTYKYDYKVENDITSVDIVVSVDHDAVQFVDDFGSRTIKDLKVGNNEILVKTVDPAGEQLVYTINVNRLDEEGKDVAPKEDDTQKGETTNNPKTGVYGVSITLLVACIVGYIIAKKKNLFKKKI